MHLTLADYARFLAMLLHTGVSRCSDCRAWRSNRGRVPGLPRLNGCGLYPRGGDGPEFTVCLEGLSRFGADAAPTAPAREGWWEVRLVCQPDPGTRNRVGPDCQASRFPRRARRSHPASTGAGSRRGPAPASFEACPAAARLPQRCTVRRVLGLLAVLLLAGAVISVLVRREPSTASEG